MGFANPIEAVVSVTLSVGGKDFFYWPGYAGEDDAPVWRSIASQSGTDL